MTIASARDCAGVAGGPPPSTPTRGSDLSHSPTDQVQLTSPTTTTNMVQGKTKKARQEQSVQDMAWFLCSVTQ